METISWFDAIYIKVEQNSPPPPVLFSFTCIQRIATMSSFPTTQVSLKRFEIFLEEKIHIVIFWVTTPFGVKCGCQRHERTYATILRQPWRFSPEILVPTYQTFLITCLPAQLTHLPWRWSQYVIPKTSTKLSGVTFQKTVSFINDYTLNLLIP
jgi:hypothetical protein